MEDLYLFRSFSISSRSPFFHILLPVALMDNLQLPVADFPPIWANTAFKFSAVSEHRLARLCISLSSAERVDDRLKPSMYSSSERVPAVNDSACLSSDASGGLIPSWTALQALAISAPKLMTCMMQHAKPRASSPDMTSKWTVRSAKDNLFQCHGGGEKHSCQ